MMAPPTPAVTPATSAGGVAESRAASTEVRAPRAPVAALLAARAEQARGNSARALVLLRQALPGAGELAPALRLEAASAAIIQGLDPGGFLAPLLKPSALQPVRWAAVRFLQANLDTLPTARLQRLQRLALTRPLRRELAAVLAERSRDVAAAARLLRSHVGDQAALRTGRWLAAEPALTSTIRVLAADALLAGGEWNSARSLLADTSPPDEPALRARWAFLRGRASYRLGDLAAATAAFAQAAELVRTPAGRFEVRVQQARVAELLGNLPDARAFWDGARAVQPREVEGWDGGARVRALAGEADPAVHLLRRAPAAVQSIAAPRLAAVLVARGELGGARRTLAGLPEWPAVRAVWLALHLRAGEAEHARADALALLTDPAAGGWQEYVLDCAGAAGGETPVTAPTRDVRALAEIAWQGGAGAAQATLADDLARDAAWAPLLTGAPTAPTWEGPAAELVAADLGTEAALLFPHRFPAATPAELAWSACRLAALGNASAALGTGEALWARLGPVPAGVLPEALLRAIAPPELVAGCESAAAAHGVPPSWLFALVRQESHFDPGSFSAAGAIGIAQLIPEVVRRLGATTAEARDHGRALDLAAGELARLKVLCGEDLTAVAAAYNAGEAVTGNWRHTLGDGISPMLLAAAIPYRETAAYVLAVREGAALARHLR